MEITVQNNRITSNATVFNSSILGSEKLTGPLRIMNYQILILLLPNGGVFSSSGPQVWDF